MPYEHYYRRHVEFPEVDMGGVVHFANYFRYMECAEHSFFRAVGIPILGPYQGQAIAWPRIKVACNYHRPLHNGDEFEIHVAIASRRRSSIELFMTIDGPATAPDGGGRERCAVGAFRLVLTEIDTAAGRMKSMAIPPEMVERLEVAPPEVVAAFGKPWA